MLYKGAAVAGGIGTVGGVTGVAVLANKDSANFEQTKKKVEEAAQKEELKNFLETFGITAEGEKSIFKTIEDKTKDFKKGEKIDFAKVVSSISGIGETKIDSADEKNIGDKIKDKIKDKNRDDIEKIDLKKDLSDLKDLIGKLPELKLEKGTNNKQNNLCEVVQKELFKKLVEKEFKLEFEEKTGEQKLPTLIKACLTKKTS